MYLLRRFWVASFSEAWIEIRGGLIGILGQCCRLLLGGVDWNTASNASYGRRGTGRLLLGGVDWNITIGPNWPITQWSPPSRRRGLKFLNISETLQTMSRLLLGGVDWNVGELMKEEEDSVASFSEAWIEILLRLAEQNVTGVASFSEAWIEILSLRCRIPSPESRLLLGGVDWNRQRKQPNEASQWSPPSRRRGLKYLATYISFRC